MCSTNSVFITSQAPVPTQSNALGAPNPHTRPHLRVCFKPKASHGLLLPVDGACRPGLRVPEPRCPTSILLRLAEGL